MVGEMGFMDLTELLTCFMSPLPLAFFKGVGFHQKNVKNCIIL